jgi:hypothetical protein
MKTKAKEVVAFFSPYHSDRFLFLIFGYLEIDILILGFKVDCLGRFLCFRFRGFGVGTTLGWRDGTVVDAIDSRSKGTVGYRMSSQLRCWSLKIDKKKRGNGHVVKRYVIKQ